jgi:hypothetical protein
METQKWSADQIHQEFSDCQSLDDLIRKIEDRHWERGEVICEIKVNNMIIRETDEQKFADASLDAIENLSVRFSRTDDLATEALQSILASIPKVTEAAIYSAELFRTQDYERAQSLVATLIENCQFSMETLSTLRNTHAQWFSEGMIEQLWTRAETGFERMVKELLAGYEKKDYVLVADVLEYEIPVALDHWREMIQSMLVSQDDGSAKIRNTENSVGR